MKLLLTSTGLSNPAIQNTFLDLTRDFKTKELKIALITTAANTPSEKEKIKNNLEQLKNLNIDAKNILEINIADGQSVQQLNHCQVMFVCGGNTFYLLHQLRTTGFDQVIKNFVQNNGVFVGVSAGSIVVTPDISVANIEPADPNEVNMTDFTGLSLINFEVSPHVPEYVSYEAMDEYSQQTKNKIITIDHDCAVLVSNNQTSIVGPGQRRFYN
ncbi:MAG: Type 1 glutamine amidotransferase-like domain-containing protein [Candidatus Pacebacteria bacterium]|nr:Type 1 glutamine amidotransferase-like domain-containing protein [Candidatus Paceibacterota bacterium]